MNKLAKLTVAAGWAAIALLVTDMAWAAAPAPPPADAAGASKPLEVSAKIRAIDMINQTIKTEDGRYFMVPSSINLQQFKDGDEITVTGDTDKYGTVQVKAVSKKTK